jgi:hypothetical protein
MSEGKQIITSSDLDLTNGWTRAARARFVA